MANGWALRKFGGEFGQGTQTYAGEVERTMVVQVKGYVADVPYVRAFIHELAPAWLDHVAVISGLMPPALVAAKE